MLTTGVCLGAGENTASFLLLGGGARAVGMGEAISATVDDATALTWNPAGLAAIETQSISAMHAEHIDDSAFEYVAAAQRLDRLGVVAIGLQYFTAGDVVQRDTAGNPAGTLEPSDLSIALGWAKTLRGFSVGLAGKFVKSTLIDSADTFTGDLGLLSPFFWREKMRVALTGRNIGGSLKFDQASEDLPTVYRGGVLYKIRSSWVLDLEVEFPKDEDAVFLAGTEWLSQSSGRWNYALRAGYNNRTTSDVDGFTGISFGGGLIYRRLRFDYGVTPFGDLGITHNLSLTYNR